jgi:O-antigen ligase
MVWKRSSILRGSGIQRRPAAGTERDVTDSPADSKRSSALPRIAAGALLFYFVMLGGSEAGVFLVAFQIANALIGAVLVVWWLRTGPRGIDRVDMLATLGLLAFLVSCVTSQHPRQSFDAAVAALAWAAAFGVGRRLLADEGNRLLCLQLLALCGLVLAIGFTVVWGSVWVAWIQLFGGLPPADLGLPAQIYRHYYVVAMILAALAPASVFLLRHPVLRFPSGMTLLLTAVLGVMSGSRIVWLALVLALAAAVVQVRPSPRVAKTVGAGMAVVAALGLVTGLGGSILQRLVEGGTVGYRLDVWRSALDLWSHSPVVGIGPGTIGIGLTSSDLMSVYEFTNRHADNALIQLAAEGGLIGLLGALFVAAGIMIGRRPKLPGARPAVLGLTVLGVLSLANNPADSPNLVAIAIAYAALLAPYEAEPSPREAIQHHPIVTTTTWVSASVLGASVVLVAAGAVMQGMARAALGNGDHLAAISNMRIAARLDPSLALYHRDLGVLLIESDLRAALGELDNAAGLNPADIAVARARAIVRDRLGDREGAAREAARATDLRPLEVENWLTLALVSDGDGRNTAVAQALHLAPWLSGSPVFPMSTIVKRPVSVLLHEDAVGTGWRVSRDPIEGAWLRSLGLPITAPQSAADRELDAVLNCHLDQAQVALDELGDDWSDSPTGMVATAMLARLRSDPDVASTVRAISLRRPDLGAAAAGTVSPYSYFVDLPADPQLYRRLGIGPDIGGPVLPRGLDALSAWLADPAEASNRSQTGINLDGCPS